MSTIATLCARGGSKGLPGKNIRPFAGVPLIVHTIRHALGCPEIAGVYVSTDDPAIAKIAEAAGAEVPFLRPAELATDAAPKLPAVDHLVRQVESTGIAVARVVDLQPTSPLRTVADIQAALRVPGADLVASVCAARDNPYFNLVEAQADGSVRLSKGSGADRRQDLPAVYALNGAIYVWQRAALAHAAVHGLWSVRVAPYVMPPERSVDIDDLQDFEYAEWLHARQGHGR